MPHFWDGNPYFWPKILYESVSIRITKTYVYVFGMLFYTTPAKKKSDIYILIVFLIHVMPSSLRKQADVKRREQLAQLRHIGASNPGFVKGDV